MGRWASATSIRYMSRNGTGCGNMIAWDDPVEGSKERGTTMLNEDIRLTKRVVQINQSTDRMQHYDVRISSGRSQSLNGLPGTAQLAAKFCRTTGASSASRSGPHFWTRNLSSHGFLGDVVRSSCPYMGRC